VIRLINHDRSLGIKVFRNGLGIRKTSYVRRDSVERRLATTL
jgi:hypothetical protein